MREKMPQRARVRSGLDFILKNMPCIGIGLFILVDV